jgi:hypothetical protein
MNSGCFAVADSGVCGGRLGVCCAWALLVRLIQSYLKFPIPFQNINFLLFTLSDSKQYPINYDINLMKVYQLLKLLLNIIPILDLFPTSWAGRTR